MYNIIFNLNPKIVNTSIEITENISKFSYNKETNLLLRKASKVKSINSSCALELSKLNEEEVAAILNEESILAPRNEIIEVKNSYDVYNAIDKFDQYSVDAFIKAHCIFTNSLVKDSGIFRSTNNAFIFDKDVLLRVDFNLVDKSLKYLFGWAKKSDLNPLIKSCLIHYELMKIFPFNNSSIKLAMFWQALMLYDYNSIFEYIPIESLIYENSKRYYELITLAKSRDVCTSFVEFILEMTSKTIDKMNYNDFKIKNSYYAVLSKTEKMIINVLVEYLNNSEFVTVDIAVALLNKNKDNVRKYFGILVKHNLLIPEGENKGRIYYLNKDILE